MNKQGKKKQTNKQMKEWRGGGEKGKQLTEKYVIANLSSMLNVW